MQNPSIGRIVHYVLPQDSGHAGEHRPAIVTEVHQPITSRENPGMANLTVCKSQDDDSGHQGPVYSATSVVYSEENHMGTWHWPEVVPEIPGPTPPDPTKWRAEKIEEFPTRRGHQTEPS
jgi:hypothetical protein